LVGGFVACWVFIRPGFERWRDQPVFTSVELTNYPVWEVYFPAVTICSTNRVVQHQLRTAMKHEP
jgi:hypothetical protein